MTRITPEQRNQIGDHIISKLAERGCAVCSNRNPEQFIPGEAIVGLPGITIPFVVITCGICGNVSLFNAWQTSVVSPP